MVQREPDGLDADQVATTLGAAAALDTERLENGFDPAANDLLAALPLISSTKALPTSAGDGTTAITYLFGSARATAGAQTRAAEAYAQRLGPDSDVVGVTGPIAAQREQGRVISDRLPLVEIGTITLVLLVVGIAFRSVVAPLVTVGTALLVGVVADYSSFYLFATRDRLRERQDPRSAALGSTAAYSSVILTAGITVAAGTASLLASSLLSVLAALGITTWVFQDLAARGGLTFSVPFATTVLLLALGSDDNVFSVGRIWEAARNQSLREAVRQVTPRTNAAIRTAGIALAGSLALVALVPLWSFQESALTMAVGLLLDVFVVRTFLVPALTTLVGPVSRWPGARPSEQPA